ncbi:MAG: prepilin-type N-terminal cleavage/methylation domain-containing protein [Patescibacteria group bacterium]|nr:prepilin-type N-terminal cleavage/methylation domain-containing protein [Patescibacteria group bacterium]
MKFSIFNFQFSKSGFTLSEIMIAISVILVGILGIYALVPKLVSINFSNLNRFVASQLLKEGVEIVKNIRDTNYLEGENWDNGLTFCSLGCEIDYDDSGLTLSQGRYLIDSGDFYNYEQGQETKFKRAIFITPQGADTLKVKVEVSWKGKGSPLEIREDLYNWR